MIDIYEYKANKYKYKYLKLKKEYFAEGGAGNAGNAGNADNADNAGNADDDLNCVANSLIKEDDFKTLDIKTIIGNPIYYNEIVIPFDKKKKDYYQREYYTHYYKSNVKIEKEKIKHICRKYEGLLLKNKETNYEIIKKYDYKNYNTPEIIYIGKLNYIYEKISNLKILFNKTLGQLKKIGQYITNYNIITKYFDNCSKFLENENITCKYMIRENIGTNIFKNIVKGDDEDNINEDNIKIILLSLKTGIDILITELYKNNYILNTIDENNMILKKEFILVTNEYFIEHKYQGDAYPNYYLDYKVYFTDYTKLTKCNDNNRNNDIKALGKFIKWLFSNFQFENKENKEIKDIEQIVVLVKKLYEDTESNKINNPADLSLKLDAIIKLINVDIRIKSKRFEFFRNGEYDYLKEISLSSIKLEKF